MAPTAGIVPAYSYRTVTAASPFICSEYAHGVKEAYERFHSSNTPVKRQIRPPTMIHIDKMRILEKNRLKGQRIGSMKGPVCAPRGYRPCCIPNRFESAYVTNSSSCTPAALESEPTAAAGDPIGLQKFSTTPVVKGGIDGY